MPMNRNLVSAARLLMGATYTLNGFNWWVKIITPYPSISDFAHQAPPRDIVGALIDTHIMFHLVKALEMLTGLALLADVMVPLMLVAVVPVTLSVFLVDVVFIARLRGIIMGTGSLLLNVTLLMAYIDHYRGLLAWRGRPLPAAAPPPPRTGGPDPAAVLTRLAEILLPLLGPVAIVLGTVMLGWMLVMIGQYIVHPLPLSAVMPPHP
jgi:putative oxidoreductase